MTLSGTTKSPTFPTTPGAFDTTYSGANSCFVSRLDPRKTGASQLTYSTFLGGSNEQYTSTLSTDPAGVVTLTGWTRSTDHPTTIDAFSRAFRGGATDGFVSRLDPGKTGVAQLVYSTFLGGRGTDVLEAMEWLASDCRFRIAVPCTGRCTKSSALAAR